MSRENFFNAQVVGRASYSHILAFALWLKLPPPSCPGTLVNTTSQWMKHDGTTKTPSCKKELWWTNISIISTLCTRLARWPLDPQEIWGWHVLRRHAKQSGQTIAKHIRSKSSKSNHQIRLVRLVRLVSRRWSSWACARTLCDLVCLMFHELIELHGFAIKSGKEGPTRRQGIEAGFHRKFRSFCLTLCLYESMSMCFLALQNDLHMALFCWDGDSFDLHQKLKNGRSRALEHEIQWDARFACSQGPGLPGLYESPIRTLIVAASGGKVLNCFLGISMKPFWEIQRLDKAELPNIANAETSLVKRSNSQDLKPGRSTSRQRW